MKIKIVHTFFVLIFACSIYGQDAVLTYTVIGENGDKKDLNEVEIWKDKGKIIRIYRSDGKTVFDSVSSSSFSKVVSVSEIKRDFDLPFDEVYDFRNNTMYRTVLGPKDFLSNPKFVFIKDVYPQLKWQITDSSKVVDHKIVFKAQAQFRCREYTAWFLPDIPLQYGPKFFDGLPGLIQRLEIGGTGIVYELTGYRVGESTIGSSSALQSAIDNAKSTAKMNFCDLKRPYIEYTTKVMNIYSNGDGNYSSRISFKPLECFDDCQ